MSADRSALADRPGDGCPPERARVLEYLRSRAAALGPAEVRARFHAAAADFEAGLRDLTDTQARQQPTAQDWSIAQAVDHVAQTMIRAAEELRHLLGGRRPPGPPVYDALTSGAAAWARWDDLRGDLHSANQEFEGLLAAASGPDQPSGPTPDPPPTAPTVLVVNRSLADGRLVAEAFIAELGWKEYAMVQRLHLLDHRRQVRTLRAALGA